MLAAEKGSSSWLTTLPLSEYGFSLHKEAFQDDLCLILLATTITTYSVWQAILS